jgi:hypothetical protein
VLLAKLTLSPFLSSRRSHSNPAERRRREIIKLKSERNVIFHIKWCLSTHGNDMFRIAEQTRQREREKSSCLPRSLHPTSLSRGTGACVALSHFPPFKRSGILLSVPPFSNPLLCCFKSSSRGDGSAREHTAEFCFFFFLWNKHECHDVRHEIYSY